MRVNRELREWVFYSEDTEGRTCIHNVRECRQPSRTKDWAELQLHLDKEYINSVGYATSKEFNN